MPSYMRMSQVVAADEELDFLSKNTSGFRIIIMFFVYPLDIDAIRVLLHDLLKKKNPANHRAVINGRQDDDAGFT